MSSAGGPKGVVDGPKGISETITPLRSGSGTIDTSTEKDDSEQRETPTWTPLFLQKRVLISILCLLVIQVAALVAIYIYSQKNNGIIHAEGTYHMAWKFGPTAILTITMAIWTQVEYRAKQQASWDVLAVENIGPGMLRTEYFSQLNIIALGFSMRRGHWRVAMAILGTLLLQVTVIISTSLLERLSRTVELRTDQIVTTANFSHISSPTGLQSRKIDAVLDTIDGIRGFGMKYPDGTTQAIAYQPIAIQEFPVYMQRPAVSLTNITGRGEYFAPNITCQPLIDQFNFTLPLTMGLNTSAFNSSDGSSRLEITTNFTRAFWDGYWFDERGPGAPGKGIRPYWDILGNATINISFGIDSHSINIFIPLPSNKTICETRAWAHQTHCGPAQNETRPLGTIDWPDEMPEDCGQNMYISTVRECREPDRSASNFTFTHLHCRTENSWGTANIMAQLNDMSAPPVFQETAPYPLSQDSISLGKHIFEFTLYALSLQPGRYGHMYNRTCVTCLQNVMQIAEDGLPPGSHDWTDAQTLLSGLVAGYPRYAVQFFGLSNTIATNTTVPGSIVGESPRLVVQDLALELMVSFLLLVVLCCIGMVCTSAKFQLPRDPATLAGAIVILASNPRLPKITNLVRQDRRFSNPDDEARMVWWNPWGTSVLSRWTILFLVWPMIPVLQSTLMVSRRDGGIAVVDPYSGKPYYWTYVPAIIIASISLLIVSIEFNFRQVQPFMALVTRRRASDGLFTEQMFGMLPLRLWKAVTRRQASLIAVTIAAFLAPIATIIVSDLLTLSEEIPTQPNFPLLQHNEFDALQTYNWTPPDDGTNSPNAGLVAAARSAFNYDSDPDTSEFRFNGYSIPYFSVIKSPDYSLTNKSAVIRTTAARARHNCTFLDDSLTPCTDFVMPASKGTNNSMPCMFWNVTLPVAHNSVCPPTLHTPVWGDVMWCVDPQTSGMSPRWTNETFTPDRITRNDLPKDVLLNNHQDLYQGGYISLVTTPGPGLPTDTGCPTILRYGRQITGDCAASGMSWAACYPYIELVEVDVRFSLPQLSIEAVSPVAISSPSKDAVPPPKVLPSIGLGQLLSIYSRYEAVLMTGNARFSVFRDRNYTGYPNAEPEFDEITSTKKLDHVTVEEFGSSTPAAREKIASALEPVWMRPMSKVLSQILANSSFAAGGRLVSGPVLDHDRASLIQNEASTRILQALYGVIFLCLVFAFWTTRDMNRILPFPPMSIGALAALLLDSRILESDEVVDSGTGGPENRVGIVRRGTETLSDVELERSGVFSMPREFALRWWEGRARQAPEVDDGTSARGRFGIDYEIKAANSASRVSTLT